MKLKSMFAWLRQASKRSTASSHGGKDESPLRARLLSAEQMERHGKLLARSHRIGPSSSADLLLARLSENKDLIEKACSLLGAASQSSSRLTPADEWLLDNIYLIEEQIRISRRHLPKGYSRQLPRLVGSGAEIPRVYDIALAAISHGDGRVDAEGLLRFVAAYQTISPLQLGELWAIPIMLRLALIENLRRAAARIIAQRTDRNLADYWADQFVAMAALDPKNVVLTVADMARSNPPVATTFVAELARRLQGQGSILALPLNWIEQWLAQSGQTIERMVQLESQQQAADRVSIANSIGSLRFLEVLDWREFVETLSVVEDLLRKDPDNTYAKMDFATRDNYRGVVERLARRGRLAEHDVAAGVLTLARTHVVSGTPTAPAAHVGYYLIDKGIAELETVLSLRRGIRVRLLRWLQRIPLFTYIAPTAIIVSFFTYGMIAEAHAQLSAFGVVWLAAILSVIAFSDLGVALVNRLATRLVRPGPLPRLDFSKGIPDDARTLVVVPTMLGNVPAAQNLVEALEVRYLANRDSNLQFALLTDFLDADQAELPADSTVLDAAQHEIEALNARYSENGRDVFFLMHRPRLWNPEERKWMGYERKRGKLAALNALLRDDTAAEAFLRIVGDHRSLDRIRYVITLDTDTRLPRDAARKLVGTLAHPLNHARFDPRRRVVTRGYAILQPRIDIYVGAGRRSWYARLDGSEPGIDPYTRLVSDVYQDVFGEGSFIGKGIYDVDAFELALKDRFPAGRILSHDLLEGCYARAGLVSDVTLYEDSPSRYAVDVKRRQRWIRGDWQLLPWLLPWTPLPGGSRERNPLSILSRSKLLDNLRRSLVPASMLAMLLLGWLLSSQPGAWTLWVLSILLIPAFVSFLFDISGWPPEMPLSAHLRHVLTAVGRTLSPIPLMLACLPFEAMFSLDAIFRTLWRMLVSKRHLLQWNPSSEVERTLGNGLLASLRSMWIGPVAALASAGILIHLGGHAALIASPILLLWLLSPALMWWLGRPVLRKPEALSVQQARFLARLTRRTWSFFETWMSAEDHWLPPDNVQEHPNLQVARRTSPTNIGLSLLANLAAYDFGYLQLNELMERTAATLQTLESLPRFRGHFYNWYDTETLEVLAPSYISTVDSGNLAGHLLTLRQGLLALVDAPVLAPSTWSGLRDTVEVLAEVIADGPGLSTLLEVRKLLDGACANPHATSQEAAQILAGLNVLAASLDGEYALQPGHPNHWILALTQQVLAAQEELQALAARPQTTSVPVQDEMVGIVDSRGAERHSQSPARVEELQRLAHVAGQCAQMDFVFLYDSGRHLLSIGYNTSERRLDSGHYDLLASEARLANFIAIAQNQLPQESWFALGRLITEIDGDAALLSWSGSMFEYLMPQLVMPSYEDTLLERTAQASVRRQIEYGRQRNVPWGISESAYNMVDAHSNYQYRAFGVPGLGLRRGLARDLVIAPYASMMALMVAPKAACENLQRLSEAGFSGRHGLYEAIDYTPERLPRGQTQALIRSYMAHHQGMGFLSLAYLLRDQPMQKRFSADTEFQATLLLLQERIPRAGAYHPHVQEAAATDIDASIDETRLRILRTVDSALPAVQLLSNGRYRVMLTSAGGGYSRCGDLSVTRWREDTTRDNWGSFCFLRDVESGSFWSTSYQPVAAKVDNYEAIFSDGKAEFRGSKYGFDTHTEIAVSPEDDIELRRVTICNRSRGTRVIEITTYAELVLAPGISDELHPAFSNLFVQTELLPAQQAIIATRRPRTALEKPPWSMHVLAIHGADVDAISYETDRARFIGRGNDLRRPQALAVDEALSNSAGSVLDPIFAIRCRLTLKREQKVTIDMVTGVALSRDDCTGLIDKYRDRHLADRVFDLAWTHSQVVRRQINASQADAQIFERLAGMLIYAHAAMRADPSILMLNHQGQSGLWGQGISGDHPIVVVKIVDATNIELVRQMVQAHAYWHLKGLTVDLVIWNDDQTGYRQQLQDQIMGMVSAGVEANVIDRPGGIFVRAASLLSHEERILLQAVARIIVSDREGSLSEQVRRKPPSALSIPFVLDNSITRHQSIPSPSLATSARVIDPRVTGQHPNQHPDDATTPNPYKAVAISAASENGIGGFSSDGREYVIDLRPGETTPAPWANVIANAAFGTVLSESSLGYTWGENAHEFRLTPWHNDPVVDSCGEAFYLRDEETGQLWCPTPLPCRGSMPYRTRHGFGYSVYEHVEQGIASELWVFVDRDEAIKFSVLKLRNLDVRRRHLSATGYVEWILGDRHAATQMTIVTERDAESGVLLARNRYNQEFAGRCAFFDVDAPGCDPETISVSGDRTEFIGRNGSLREPDAMLRERLSNRLGAALDPCAAIQVPLQLEPGEETELVFRLGLGRDDAAALSLARQARGNAMAGQALAKVHEYWRRTLGAVEVDTPDRSMDLLANGWLLYQTIACRYFARSGYYQSGGAFGFRDQLQDSMAMLHAEPQLGRAHLLLCAAHQFPQGDVQHWWHPPLDRGVRTRCSDDYLWLPLATCRYLELTGDRSVLDESVAYIEGRPLNLDEESYYDLPVRSPLREDLYRHCVRALERGWGLLGERGLPLIGSGDWNDGMNRVGEGGKGESVWLGFFLFDVSTRFAPVARARGDFAIAHSCEQNAALLRENIEKHAWDGDWYRRAWYDNGAPLGAAQNEECRIDSISQSWSVLSGAGNPQRARQAMSALDSHLVRRDAGLIQLLEPPFDKTLEDPGYIRGYVPGVRENGGQYTHAAIWTIMAFAELGDHERAWELLRLINPLHHADTAERVAIYKVEPYVVAADVYAVAPHTGRGGWSWYTGSAGWMYRLMIESLLGLRRQGQGLRIEPCIPADWSGYRLSYRYGDTAYRIQVTQSTLAGAVNSVSVDGVDKPDRIIPLLDDGVEHAVEVVHVQAVGQEKK
ncbi:MAG: cyclic beta 1-2 glucan synthetase [Xanthomonadales bacterium]|nr:cyclic beta 1-2 glucan synthetase [Xanthomonadales bacterium]